jgi:hypothetical protein
VRQALRCSRSALLAASSILALLPAGALAAGTERPIAETFPASEIRQLVLENLAGNVTLVGTSGNELRVSGTVFAEDSAGSSATALADSLRVEVERFGDRVTVVARYPVDRHRAFHYPRRSSRAPELPWFLQWAETMGSNVRYQGRQVRVTGRADRGAATLYADFRLELPVGIVVSVKNSVGEIRSRGVDGEQRLDSASGPIEALDSRGRLVADTGSGDVTVQNHAGDVEADTGSGDVRLSDVRGGRIKVDTGSGDVELVDCRGAIDADTGSGDIVARGLIAGPSFRADTGSGDVRAAGDFSGVRDLEVDTGSGDVTLTFTNPPAITLGISTGSGDIDLDVEGARVRRLRRNRVEVELGGGGGRGKISTGSGDVSLRAAR